MNAFKLEQKETHELNAVLYTGNNVEVIRKFVNSYTPGRPLQEREIVDKALFGSYTYKYITVQMPVTPVLGCQFVATETGVHVAPGEYLVAIIGTGNRVCYGYFALPGSMVTDAYKLNVIGVLEEPNEGREIGPVKQAYKGAALGTKSGITR